MAMQCEPAHALWQPGPEDVGVGGTAEGPGPMMPAEEGTAE